MPPRNHYIIKRSCPIHVSETSTSHFEMQTTDRTTHRDEVEPNSYGASSIGSINFGMLDDSSNSPRAPTADRVGQEEKEKRKKKVTF